MKTENETRAIGSNGPYKDLFIYHIKGQVTDEDELAFGEKFVGNWVEDETSFLFFSVPSREIVLELLRKRSDLESIEDYHFTYEQWQGSALKPTVIEHFCIQPPWYELDAGEGEVKIILDPGVVFGTGLHPTTRDCLRTMVHLHRQFTLDRVLDLGTGTGILALAAAFLGAKKVLAVDLNPLSVKTAQRNIRLNDLEGSIEVVKGQAEDFVDEAADLIVANLHHSVIENLLEKKGFQEKSWFIISGLLRSEARDTKSQLKKYNLHVVHEWDHEMTWFTMLVRNGKWARQGRS
ncbi:MAG: 50S ribosomal protein L11 methyltransferase [Deltaproteobacteria bacterium]|nr:MAG: 50S ribosomal protein L11 methyltransferase [Deltaproteobacteria bacterium]